MESLPTTTRLRCQSSLTLGGMTDYLSENRRYACDSSESRGSQAAAKTIAPRSGVIFGGSRKARPPQPPKINFVRDRPPANSIPQPPNVKNDKKMHVFCWMLQLFVLLLGQAIRRKDGFVVFADQKILVKFLTQAKHKFVPRRRPTFDVRDFKLVSTLRTWAFCAYSVRFTRAFWL